MRRSVFGSTAGVLALLLITGALARGAEKKDADKAEADLKKMQGEWSGTTSNGDEVSYVFKGDKLTAKSPRGEIEATIKLDPAAKPEKTMDAKIGRGGDDAE